jgi:hypothetical protein
VNNQLDFELGLSQWERLTSHHCTAWVGTRSWYDADAFILDSVKAHRLLEADAKNTSVTQINRYFELDHLTHEEKWQLEKTADNGTYFPPIPGMRSYFGPDGHSLWAPTFEAGKPFKFEFFFYQGEATSLDRTRMSLMLMYDATGRFERLWQVKEADYRNTNSTLGWSDSLFIEKMTQSELGEMWIGLEDAYETGVSYSGDVDGNDLQHWPMPLVSIPAPVGYVLPDGCTILLPSQLGDTDFSAFARLDYSTGNATVLRSTWARAIEHPTLTVTHLG